MSACPNCGYARWLSPTQHGPCNCSPEAIKRASERVYSDDFKRCDCGSETFARFEVYAYPPLFDGHKVQLPDSYRCAHCKRPGVRKAVSDA